MIMRKIAWTGAALLLLSASAFAEQDFYGIKIKNELWARNLVLSSGPKANKADLRQGPVSDASIYAEGVIRPVPPDKTDFRILVVNDSPKPLPVDYKFRDFFLILRNGQRIPLVDPDQQWALTQIAPKSNATFTPSLGRLEVSHEDIRMIECSFDSGATKIFLFPASMKEVVHKLKTASGGSTPAAAVSAPAKVQAKPGKHSEKAADNFEYVPSDNAKA